MHESGGTNKHIYNCCSSPALHCSSAAKSTSVFIDLSRETTNYNTSNRTSATTYLEQSNYVIDRTISVKDIIYKSINLGNILLIYIAYGIYILNLFGTILTKVLQ